MVNSPRPLRHPAPPILSSDLATTYDLASGELTLTLAGPGAGTTAEIAVGATVMMKAPAASSCCFYDDVSDKAPGYLNQGAQSTEHCYEKVPDSKAEPYSPAQKGGGTCAVEVSGATRARSAGADGATGRIWVPSRNSWLAQSSPPAHPLLTHDMSILYLRWPRATRAVKYRARSTRGKS